MLCIFILILPNEKLNCQTVQYWAPGTHVSQSCWLFLFFLKSNVERTCRTVEDQFNEVKAKDDQQTQLVHDRSVRRAKERSKDSGKIAQNRLNLKP